MTADGARQTATESEIHLELLHGIEPIEIFPNSREELPKLEPNTVTLYPPASSPAVGVTAVIRTGFP